MHAPSTLATVRTRGRPAIPPSRHAPLRQEDSTLPPSEPATASPRDLPKLATLGLLHMGQYFPQALAGVTLPFLLRKEGLPLEMFWLLALPAVPRWFKWLIALLVDNHGSARFGRRKSWILPCTLIGASTYLLLAFIPPSLATLYVLVATLVAKSFVMAAQDIAVDAYAAEAMTPAERPLGTAIINFLAVLGTILGTGAVALVSRFGWEATMIAASTLLVLAALPALLRAEPAPPAASRARQARGERASLRRALTRPEARMVLPCMAVFGFGGGFLQSMLGPFFADKGLSLTQFGIVALCAGVLGTGIGALLTPWLVARIGLARTAMLGLGGILPILGGALGVVAWLPDVPPLPVLVCVGALVFVALTVYDTCVGISRFQWVSAAQAGTDYSLQSSFLNLGGWLAGSVAGVLAAQVGWVAFFPLAALFIVCGGVLYLRVLPRVDALVLAHSTANDGQPQAKQGPQAMQGEVG